MSLTKEFNAKAEPKRRVETETETWSETKHLSRYFCAAAMRRKQIEVEKVIVVQVAPAQPTFVRRGAPRFS